MTMFGSRAGPAAALNGWRAPQPEPPNLPPAAFPALFPAAQPHAGVAPYGQAPIWVAVPGVVAGRPSVQRISEPAGDACVVPTPGLGRAELDRRVNQSAQRSTFRKRDFFSLPSIEDRAELFVNSVPGGRNDAKRQVKGAAEYGNFLFGAEAAARGISRREAQSWATKAQIVQDILKRKVPSGHDNVDDPEQIARGYAYFRAGCSKR